MLLFTLLLACAVTSVFSVANLTGAWHKHGSSSEQYTLTPGPPPADYTAACSAQGTPCGWSTAAIGVTASGALTVTFSNGVKDTGEVAAGGDSLQWSTSAWDRSAPPPPPAPMHIHLCPHSHLDPGWYQTVDQLYEATFKGIVEGVISGLALDPSRTFAAEHAIIFAMYYERTNATMRALMKSHVARGALEFTGGGWVQPDEAITRHEDLIDQLVLGRAFINSVLGQAPLTTVWLADPFGHSSSSAAMHAAAFSDLLLLGRPMSPLDPIVSVSGAIWHPTASAPTAGAFAPSTSILTTDYGLYCNPYRAMRSGMDAGHVNASVAALLLHAAAAAAQPPFRQHVIVMFGDDAPSESPFETMYPAMDALIAGVNALSRVTNVTVSYSTPTRYVAALAQSLQPGQANPTFQEPYPSRPSYDMLPLVGNEFPYWVGYYTSRPELKAAIHASSAFFRASSQLHALAHDSSSWEEGVGALLPLWRALGLAQHHDIITGDCWDPVSEDNQARLLAGRQQAAGVATGALALLAGSGSSASAADLCLNATASPCLALAELLAAGEPARVTVYNPAAWARAGAQLELLVPVAAVAAVQWVVGSGGVVQAVPLDCQCSPVAPGALPDLPPQNDWYFLACPVDLLALGGAVVELTAAEAVPVAAAAPASASASASAPGFTLSNPQLTLTFDASGTLQSMATPAVPAIALSAALGYFASPAGQENAWDFSTAGSATLLPWPAVPGANATLVTGPVFSELTVAAPGSTGSASLRWRLYANESAVHLWVGVGPFVEQGSGSGGGGKPPSQDAFLSLTSSIASGSQWYTDSNGLELQLRKRWWRPWTAVNYSGFAGNEPVAINSEWPASEGGGVGGLAH